MKKLIVSSIFIVYFFLPVQKSQGGVDYQNDSPETFILNRQRYKEALKDFSFKFNKLQSSLDTLSKIVNNHH